MFQPWVSKKKGGRKIEYFKIIPPTSNRMSRLSGDVKPTVYKLKCKDTLARKEMSTEAEMDQPQPWKTLHWNGPLITNVMSAVFLFAFCFCFFIVFVIVFPLLKNYRI